MLRASPSCFIFRADSPVDCYLKYVFEPAVLSSVSLCQACQTSYARMVQSMFMMVFNIPGPISREYHTIRDARMNVLLNVCLHQTVSNHNSCLRPGLHDELLLCVCFRLVQKQKYALLPRHQHSCQLQRCTRFIKNVLRYGIPFQTLCGLRRLTDDGRLIRTAPPPPPRNLPLTNKQGRGQSIGMEVTMGSEHRGTRLLTL